MTRFCTNCGKKLEDDAAFCTNCGTKVKEVEVPKKTQTSFYDMVNVNNKKEKTKTTTDNKTPTQKEKTKTTTDNKTPTQKEKTEAAEKKTSDEKLTFDKSITNKLPNSLSLDKITDNIPDNISIDKITDSIPDNINIDKITDSIPNNISDSISIDKITDSIPENISLDKITDKSPNANEIITSPTNQPSIEQDPKKRLKELVGGFTFSNEFSSRLKREGLSSDEGNQIKNKLKNEVSSGKVDANDLERRLDEITKEIKIKKGELNGKLKYVDEFFETEETQHKISEHKFNERKINEIKDNIKKDLQNDYYLEKAYVPKKANAKLDSVHKREKQLGIAGYDFSCVIYETRHGMFEDQEEPINGYCFVEKEKLTIKKRSAILNIDKGSKVLRYSKINAIDYDKAGLLQFTSSIVIGVSGFPSVILRYATSEDFELLHNAWLEYNNPSKKEPAVEQVPVVAPVSNADELMKYAELYEKGFLTEEEFNAVKKKLLDF